MSNFGGPMLSDVDAPPVQQRLGDVEGGASNLHAIRDTAVVGFRELRGFGLPCFSLLHALFHGSENGGCCRWLSEG